jgi:hypothetical protein
MKDEQALTEHFEAVCGGVEKAQGLFRIWKNSYANRHPNPRYSKTREEVFEATAKNYGYTDEQIQAFYACQ